MIERTIILWISLISFSLNAQVEIESNEDLMEYLHGKDPLVNTVLDSSKYRLQFMYTRIERDSTETHLKTFDFSNADNYFYPASMVKLPTALVSFEKLKKHGVSRESYLKIHRDQVCGNMGYIEETEKGRLTFTKMTRELMAVSNNTYYNTFYHLATPKRLNDRLIEQGFEKTKIYKSFTGCEMPLNLYCNSLTITDEATKKTVIQNGEMLPLSEVGNRLPYTESKLLGSRHEYRGEIVEGRFDFNYNLEYPLSDMHYTLARLALPEQFPPEMRWDIREEDRLFILDAMQLVPNELANKDYHDNKNYPDNVFKYLVLGDDNEAYKDVISHGKMGISYGFVTESTYIVDTVNNVDFILTVNLYVNANDVVNDGKYEYEDVARPFMAKFGQLILEYERQRKK
ncbi:MAG: hypothetical protein ACI837_001062 [Crocinitomicaceae bacterium]|jgi:hypothetical protein